MKNIKILKFIQPKKPVSIWFFWFVVVAIYCFTVVTIEFHGVPISNFKSFAITAFQWCVVSACASGVLLLLLVNRLVFAVLFPVLFAFSSIICFYNLTIGVTLTPVTIELALVNDMTMWATVISPMLVGVILLAGLISLPVVLYRWYYVEVSRRSLPVAICLGVVIVAMPVCLIPRIQAPVVGRLPFSIYYSFKKYFDNVSSIQEVRNTYDGVVCTPADNPPDIFFVLGESLRSDHLPFNGYPRNTMPRLSADSSVISFSDIYSDYIHTSASVPHIMTRADSLNTDAAYNDQSFISVFRNTGYSSAWFANQDLSKSYAYFAYECDTLYYCNAANSLYSYNKWLDKDVLEPFENWLDCDTAGKPQLAVIHAIGSHWWYKSHYEDEQAVFLPDIDNKDIAALTDEQIINSYDNTIIATDDFLADLINMVKNRNAVVFFISDHGESLGENGLYLHATDSNPLHHPACLVWYSEKYASAYPRKVDAMKKMCGKPFSTAAVFHTVIDIAGIETSVFNPQLSMLDEKKNYVDCQIIR